MKSDYAETDAISDDVAGHAYIEQFGLETFQRADNAMRAHKVTRYCLWIRLDLIATKSSDRQTADTFQAAATFLDLVQIWGPLDDEIAAKIKFAKYHALRIAKAIKAGEDPNLSNPAPEPEAEPTPVSPLDPSDPEVQLINGNVSSENTNRQPTVEDVANESGNGQRFSSHQYYGAPPSPLATAENQHPPLSPLESRENYYTNPNLQPDVSPLAPPSAGRRPSLRGGYFPTVPAGVDKISSSAPDVSPPEAVSPEIPPASHPASQSTFPGTASTPNNSSRPPSSSLHSFPPPGEDDIIPPTVPSTEPKAPETYHHPTVRTAQSPRFPNPTQAPARAPMPTRRAIPPINSPAAPPPVTTELKTDEEAMQAAQKHARWAISALNFEDVKTAVKELREALDSLGAR